MVGALSMKNAEEDDLEAIINEQIFDEDAGMSDDALIIYDKEIMCFPMQKFKNVLESLGNYSIDLGKGCELTSEGINSLDLKKGTMDQHQVIGSLSR